MTSGQVATAYTGAGMLALWCTATFDDVDDYETWEERVNEGLDTAIVKGELVPVGIQADGAFGVRVIVAPEVLTDREQRYPL